MSAINVYCLPEPLYGHCVVYRELYEYLGFKDDTGTGGPQREARHVFASALRKVARETGIPAPEPIVVSGMLLIEFNKLVYKEHGFRFHGAKIRVFKGQAVAYILAAIRREDGGHLEHSDADMYLLTCLDKNVSETFSARYWFEHYKTLFSVQPSLFEKRPQATPTQRKKPVEVPKKEPTAVVVSPVVSLEAVMAAITGWVKSGRMSQDLGDRYLVDYMQRHGVIDFTIDPPPLPPTFNRPESKLSSAEGMTLETQDLPFKATFRGPCLSALSIYRNFFQLYGDGGLKATGISQPIDIHEIARDLQIYQHSFWGKEEKGEWMYDTDAVRHILRELDKRRKRFQAAPSVTA